MSGDQSNPQILKQKTRIRKLDSLVGVSAFGLQRSQLAKKTDGERILHNDFSLFRRCFPFPWFPLGRSSRQCLIVYCVRYDRVIYDNILHVIVRALEHVTCLELRTNLCVPHPRRVDQCGTGYNLYFLIFFLIRFVPPKTCRLFQGYKYAHGSKHTRCVNGSLWCIFFVLLGSSFGYRNVTIKAIKNGNYYSRELRLSFIH